jgi:hypothetical protein
MPSVASDNLIRRSCSVCARRPAKVNPLSFARERLNPDKPYRDNCAQPPQPLDSLRHRVFAFRGAPEEIMTLAETFDQLDWEAIESYLKLGQEENLHLDFKTVKNADMTATDDKRNLARGISGFANSNGGIIVWGVDARKNADGVDCANSIAKISKPALMVSRLNTLTGDATSPIVDGIRHRAITNPETNAGVVVTLVE